MKSAVILCFIWLILSVSFNHSCVATIIFLLSLFLSFLHITAVMWCFGVELGSFWGWVWLLLDILFVFSVTKHTHSYSHAFVPCLAAAGRLSPTAAPSATHTCHLCIFLATYTFTYLLAESCAFWAEHTHVHTHTHCLLLGAQTPPALHFLLLCTLTFFKDGSGLRKRCELVMQSDSLWIHSRTFATFLGIQCLVWNHFCFSR